VEQYYIYKNSSYRKESFLSRESDTNVLQSTYFAYEVVGIISCYSHRTGKLYSHRTSLIFPFLSKLFIIAPVQCFLTWGKFSPGGKYHFRKG